MASGGANLGEGCRDFVRRQNRGIRKICGGRRLKSQDRYLFNRAEGVMNGRGLTGCRSVAEAAWQSSDTALPIRASLLTACPAEVLPGVLFVRWVQREFEDLLAVLIFSPVHGNRWLPSFAGAQATSSMMLAFRERRQGQVPLYIYNESPARCRGLYQQLVFSMDNSMQILFNLLY